VEPRNPSFRDVWNRRADRARALAEKYPAAKEILNFYAGLAVWQSGVASAVRNFEDLVQFFPSLFEFVKQAGPPALVETAPRLERKDVAALLRDYWSGAETERNDEDPLSFFALALLQPYAASLPAGLDCPWCAHPPLVGSLHAQGDGLAFELVCPLCFRRRPFQRTRCPGCGESSESRLSNFTTADFPHLRILACETCRSYLFVVDMSREPAAIPEVDELAGLPLSLWALGQGYRKLQINIAGI
jgi:formate dehydrogenase maturation protein FdhE